MAVHLHFSSPDDVQTRREGPRLTMWSSPGNQRCQRYCDKSATRRYVMAPSCHGQRLACRKERRSRAGGCSRWIGDPIHRGLWPGTVCFRWLSGVRGMRGDKREQGQGESGAHYRSQCCGPAIRTRPLPLPLRSSSRMAPGSRLHEHSMGESSRCIGRGGSRTQQTPRASSCPPRQPRCPVESG